MHLFYYVVKEGYVKMVKMLYDKSFPNQNDIM